MGNWVNFAEIRERVSLEDVILRYYHLEGLRRQGDKLTGPCPVHGGDSPRAFTADLAKNVWFCFSKCKQGGNQLDFVARKEGLSIREAALRLQSHFLESPGESRPADSAPGAVASPVGASEPLRGGVGRDTEPDLEAINPPLEVELKLAGDHPHLVETRGLRSETVARFGVGYCSRGILRGTIAIPIHDEEGRLIAYAGRELKPQTIRERGKYRLPKGFRKQFALYNFHRAAPFAAERGLILVEGFFSVMKLYEAGLQNVVAAMGSDLSDHQAELLTQACAVVVLFDGNPAGWSGAEAVRQRLTGRTAVKVARLPEGLEPEDLSPAELRWLIEGFEGLRFSAITFAREAPQMVANEPETDRG